LPRIAVKRKKKISSASALPVAAVYLSRRSVRRRMTADRLHWSEGAPSPFCRR